MEGLQPCILFLSDHFSYSFLFIFISRYFLISQSVRETEKDAIKAAVSSPSSLAFPSSSQQKMGWRFTFLCNAKVVVSVTIPIQSNPSRVFIIIVFKVLLLFVRRWYAYYGSVSLIDTHLVLTGFSAVVVVFLSSSPQPNNLKLCAV